MSWTTASSISLPPLETFVLRGHRRTNRRECRGGSRDLLPEDTCVIEGVPATDATRTALDLGCTLSRRLALAALDAFMRCTASRTLT